MAATARCICGAPAPLGGAACHYCGTPPPAVERPDASEHDVGYLDDDWGEAEPTRDESVWDAADGEPVAEGASSEEMPAPEAPADEVAATAGPGGEASATEAAATGGAADAPADARGAVGGGVAGSGVIRGVGAAGAGAGGGVAEAGVPQGRGAARPVAAGGVAAGGVTGSGLAEGGAARSGGAEDAVADDADLDAPVVWLNDIEALPGTEPAGAAAVAAPGEVQAAMGPAAEVPVPTSPALPADDVPARKGRLRRPRARKVRTGPAPGVEVTGVELPAVQALGAEVPGAEAAAVGSPAPGGPAPGVPAAAVPAPGVPAPEVPASGSSSDALPTMPGVEGAAVAGPGVERAERKGAGGKRRARERSARKDRARPATPAPPAEDPGGLPPAREARRFRGLAVPLVAAVVVGGIGYPLTTLAVARVGRLPAPADEPTPPEEGAAGRRPLAAPGTVLGQARLTGAVTYDGSATPVQCAAGTPVLVTLGTGADQITIRLGLPPVPAPKAYPLQGADLFVAVTRLTGTGQTWSTRNHPEAGGEVTVKADRSVAGRFNGLRPVTEGTEGTVDGTLEVRCG